MWAYAAVSASYAVCSSSSGPAITAGVIITHHGQRALARLRPAVPANAERALFVQHSAW